jgi:hypothetical protein
MIERAEPAGGVMMQIGSCIVTETPARMPALRWLLPRKAGRGEGRKRGVPALSAAGISRETAAGRPAAGCRDDRISAG